MTQRAANAQATKMIKITTSCQCAGDKDDKQERLYGGYKMITTRVPVAATAVRTGRGSVANLGTDMVTNL